MKWRPVPKKRNNGMKFLRYIIYISVLTCIQVFFLQRMWSGFYISVYIAPVLLMDIKTPKWIVLLTGFLCGGIIDVLSAGAGLNAAITGFVALCRFPIIRATVPNNVFEDAGPVLSSTMPIMKFLFYVAIMLLIWSLLFFFVESSFMDPLWSLLSVLFNVVFGTLLITLLQLPIRR